VILVALAIAAATAVGVGAERRWAAGAVAFSRRLIETMVWGLLPFITFFIVARLHLGGGVGIGIGLAYVELAAVGGLAYLAGSRLLHLERPTIGALILTVVLANTGYLGIPLNAALLGHGALAPAIAWDTLVSSVMLYTAGFAVGAAFGTEAGERPTERLKAFFTRNPVLWALIAGLIAPESLAPQALVDIAKFCAAYALLPVGFFILGVNLMGEREGGRAAVPAPVHRADRRLDRPAHGGRPRAAARAVGRHGARAPRLPRAGGDAVGDQRADRRPRLRARPAAGRQRDRLGHGHRHRRRAGPRARDLIAPMRALVQRVRRASVTVDGATIAAIGPGLLVLLGVTHADGEAAADKLADKVAALRIFEDADGRMNDPLGDGREVLVVSQFTLYGDARKGNRPSFVGAARPEVAEPLYERFRARLGAQGGRFGAHMEVELVNDGPVTLMLETP
jgi:D-tyrosyl-tRNA(Tyr) deacylase